MYSGKMTEVLGQYNPHGRRKTRVAEAERSALVTSGEEIYGPFLQDQDSFVES
jgi:hypothetical protein